MNRYGRMAMEHFQEHRQAALAEIEGPEAFFTQAGWEIAAEVEALRDEILRRPPEGLADADTSRLSSQALAMAEETILAEHYLFTAAPAGGEEPAPADDPELAAYRRRLEIVDEAIANLYE